MPKDREIEIRYFKNKNNIGNVTAPNIDYSIPSCKRALDMLLSKYYGKKYESEVPMESHDEVKIPVLQTKLSNATIILITDGGLVPKGNPDNLPCTNSSCFYQYSIKGKDSLDKNDYEVNHQGYDNTFVTENPNRLVPVDAMRNLEKKGVIGKLYDSYIVTTGVMTPVENSIMMGKNIAETMEQNNIDAAIITSTCGTSTRCGAYIAKEIEEKGIPVVHITNLNKIPDVIGVNRIIKGENICYVLGKPSLSFEAEFDFRLNLVSHALKKLEIVPD